MTNSFVDAEMLYRVLLTQVKKICEQEQATLGLVGIYRGGAWIAKRLARDLNLEHCLGFVDPSFYRDDYSAKGLHTSLHSTDIPFDVTDTSIILIDDVLYTGRTVRAAINTLFDYGRVKRIQLAVLLDRGGRELPINPDMCAHQVNLSSEQTLALESSDQGQFSFILSTVHQ